MKAQLALPFPSPAETPAAEEQDFAVLQPRPGMPLFADALGPRPLGRPILARAAHFVASLAAVAGAAAAGLILLWRFG